MIDYMDLRKFCAILLAMLMLSPGVEARTRKTDKLDKQGMAAESASAAVILLSSTFGYSLSTTHVATGSIIGTGLGKKGADVRWNVAGRMATAWVFTLPSAAIVGAGAYGIAAGVHGTFGVIVVLLILAALSGLIYWRSRGTKVDHKNVNSEWTGGVSPDQVTSQPAAA